MKEKKSISIVFRYVGIIFLFFVSIGVNAQIDSSLFVKRVPSDSTQQESLNMDAIYRRPLFSIAKNVVNLGGYMEVNWQHIGEEGETEGNQFQFRRLSIFLSSTISKRIKFLSEIEFEPAEKSIEIEFASIDVEFNPLLNLRGGIIVNPIGAYNQNHDGPKTEFVDRPISAEQLLPATFSNAGFGLYGKYYRKDWMFGYEAYLSGGFDETIISNDKNKTYLPASKENAERFEEINSGEPLVTTKIAIKNKKIGELGLSYMGHVFNKYYDDGNVLDKKRRVDIYAVDFNTELPYTKTFINGEWSWIFVDVPETYTQQYGRKQYGGYVDIIQPILQRKILGWDNARLNLSCRLEYVDWNVGKFKATGENIKDDMRSIVFGLGFRPNSQTVVKLNYRYNRYHDILGNILGAPGIPPSRVGGFIIGIATYF